MRWKEEGPKLVLTEYNAPLFILSAVFLVIGGGMLYDQMQGNFNDDWTGIVLFLALPIFVLFLITLYKTTADYSTQILTIARKSIIKRVEKHIPFADIATIEIRESIRRGGKGGPKYFFPLYVILKNGTEELMIKPPGKGGFLVAPKPTKEEAVAKLLCQRIGAAFSFKKGLNDDDLLDTVIGKAVEKRKQEQTMQPPHS